MIRALVACTATACLYAAARAQPTFCHTDDQCQSDFYCIPDAFVCSECLDCEDLKRTPPFAPSTCVKTAADCGPCIKGLVEDVRGDVNAQCVVGAAPGPALPAYVWVAVAVGLLLFAAGVLLVLYVLRNTYTFKILASTRASVQSACGAGAVNAVPASASASASAPELPPPYHALAHYSPVRPSSPPADAPLEHYDATSGEESSWPFIKRASSLRASGARESAGSQAARVFNNPHYVRGPHLPMHEGGSGDAEAGPAADADESFVHDEDTMESTWAPSDTANGNTSSTPSSELGGLLAAARSTSLLRAPHAHAGTLCARQQDSNNNRNMSESLGGGEPSGAASTGPSFIINVVQNINTLQQQNDVTL